MNIYKHTKDSNMEIVQHVGWVKLMRLQKMNGINSTRFAFKYRVAQKECNNFDS